MSKILSKLRNSFKLNSNDISYFEEYYFNIICALIYLFYYLLDYYNINDNILFRIIRLIFAIMFFWQTYALIFRIYEVKQNKFDHNFLFGKNNFKCIKVDIKYGDFKKILMKAEESFKFYCSSNKSKNHIIHLKVLMLKRPIKIIKKYYFDSKELELSKLLKIVHEEELINNSKITIVGNDYSKNKNKEFIEHLLKQYS